MKYIHSLADRSGHRRKHPPCDTGARYLPVWNNQSLVSGLPDKPCPVFLDSIPLDLKVEPIFLGEQPGHPVFAINLSELNDNQSAEFAKARDARFIDLRRVGPWLDDDQAALLSMARALVHWQATHRFCNHCGSPLVSRDGGHVLHCTQCQRSTFPRTDAAVIVLVIDAANPDRCLLGRAPNWPAGVYSTLAGFVEPGESLEQAVEREILEEAGIVVGEVSYVASQPWPFPQSIMLGFEALAQTVEIHCQDDELDDARWFTREELQGFGQWQDDSAPYRLPRSDSIAHFLLSRWLQQGH